jgi:calcineurin-like phosphoesterase family protein
MTNRFVISDTHFFHHNSWEKFKREDGSPLRPFTSTEEMDETMIERWNAKVGPNDTVYHLGDVAINKKGLASVSRLNGRKILIRGNHDIFKDEQYREVGFEQLHGVRVFVDKFIFSHIPLFEKCVSERFVCNVTGHLHANYINSPRYLTVCVEHTNYTPLSFEEVEQRIKANQEAFAETGNVINYGGGVDITS